MQSTQSLFSAKGSRRNTNSSFWNCLKNFVLGIALLPIFSTRQCIAQTERQIQIPALNRVARLGYMYDEKTDRLIDVNVFGRKIPTEHIIETQIPIKRTEAAITNSLDKQFKLFGIDDTTAVNILTGVTIPRGAARMLNEKNQPSQASGILLYKSQTLVQSLGTFHEGLKPFFNKQILGHIEATHVITSVTWGARVAVKLDASLTEAHDIGKAQKLLSTQLRNLRGKLSPSDEIESNFQMSITSDISLPVEIPTTAKEVKDILSQVPTVIGGINEGKGIPLHYTLTPINMIRSHMGVIPQNTAADAISELTLSDIIGTFQDIYSAEERISKIQQDFNLHSNCLSPEAVTKINDAVTKLKNFKTNFASTLKKSVLEVRSGSQDNQILTDLLDEVSNSDYSPTTLDTKFSNLLNETRKFEFCRTFLKEFENIQYFGAKGDLITYLTTVQKPENGNNSVFIMFTSSDMIQTDPESYTRALNSLVEKGKEPNATCSFVLCDFPHAFCNNVNASVVLEYRNGAFNPSNVKRGDAIEIEKQILTLTQEIVELKRIQNLTGEQLELVDRTFEVLNDCTLSPCLNGGKCIVRESKRSCECEAKFTGNNCQAIKIDCVHPGECASRRVSGSSPCECRQGYVKDPHDRSKCKLENENATLIFGSSGGLEQFSLNNKSITRLLDHTPMYRGLDYLHRTNTVFWGGPQTQIHKAEMGGAAEKALVVDDAGSNILSLAVDWIYSRVYYTDGSNNKITAVNLDGTMKKVIIKDGLSWPTSIVVNPLNGWMYWVNMHKIRIERSGMDGSQRNVIANVTNILPFGLTLDLIENRLYWTTYNHPCSIFSMSPDGSDVKLVFQASPPSFANSQFWSLTTFEGSVYWRDYLTKAVYKANKCNDQDLTKLHTVAIDTDSYWTVQAYHVSKQPKGHNYCADRIHQCSHLCFPVPSIGNSSVSTTCACPDGLTLSSDQLNCS